MSGKIVRHTFDPLNPPPLTEKLRAEIAALEEMPDEKIDFSDIPPLTEEFWRNAKRNPYFRPVKQQLTLRIDSDLVAWFKHHAEGKRGYQSHINRALREYVSEQMKKAG